jgi:hypothetical protein
VSLRVYCTRTNGKNNLHSSGVRIAAGTARVTTTAAVLVVATLGKRAGRVILVLRGVQAAPDDK